MSVAMRQPMTAAEYLDWEERQEARYEFDGYGPVAMVGAREAHADIQANLITALRNGLRGRACRAYGSDTKIAVDGSYRYPAALIVCGPRDPRRIVAADPVVVFEILSDSTGGTDRVTKRAEYGRTPSIQRYVIIEQTLIGADIVTRAGDDWVGRSQGAGSVLAIPEAGIGVPLDALYEGLDLTGLAG